MLERVNGANPASLNSTYVNKSGTTVKSVSDSKLDAKDVNIKSSDGKTKVEEKTTESKVILDEQLKEALQKINMDERFRRTGCEFTYHEVSNRFSITLYDKETKEVLKEIPPEETINMLDKLYVLAGLIIDEKM